jgi:hypothetical protein
MRDGGEWSVSRSFRFTHGETTPFTHFIGGWVNPRVGLDDMTLLELEPRLLGHQARSLVTIPTKLSRLTYCYYYLLLYILLNNRSIKNAHFRNDCGARVLHDREVTALVSLFILRTTWNHKYALGANTKQLNVKVSAVLWEVTICNAELLYWY